MFIVYMEMEGVPAAAVSVGCEHAAQAVAESWVSQMHGMRVRGNAVVSQSDHTQLTGEVAENGRLFLDLHSHDIGMRQAALGGQN